MSRGRLPLFTLLPRRILLGNLHSYTRISVTVLGRRQAGLISELPRRVLLGNPDVRKGPEWSLLPNPALLARSHPRGSGGKRREAGERKRRVPESLCLKHCLYLDEATICSLENLT